MLVSFPRVINVTEYRYVDDTREIVEVLDLRSYTGDEQCEDENVVGLVGVSGSSLKYDA